ncbi:MAG TPA: DUF1778 domain-containing protein [Streptosporangiaceae bacterium]|nr:DUF1778 domain-containing protein [Streptosporangiaceae bacterium]
MAASAHNIPLRDRRIERIGFRTTEHESALIRKAADLRGLTIAQYVLCAVLDRAERDLYAHAAYTQHERSPLDGAGEPLHALANLFGA